MKKTLLSLCSGALVLAALSTSFPQSAKADIFEFHDPQGRFQVTFPDRWRATSNQKADDVLVVKAPGEHEYVECRVRVRPDNRYAVYPANYAPNIQHVAYSREFWENYLGDYNDVHVDAFHDDAGMGRGFASWADVSFTTAQGPLMEKRGIMFVSLYENNAFIIDCSAQKAAYEKWRPSFLSFIKSIEFTPITTPFRSGYYRNFMGDQPLQIRGASEHDVDIY